MIRFFSARELSERLDINLAKLKRWSREFLPPDVLGGFQSGYARQYSQDEIFTVYLGGLLVSDLKFSVPEAKKILADLSPWLSRFGFYRNSDPNPETDTAALPEITRYRIYIYPGPARMEFFYTIRGIVSEDPVMIQNHGLRQSCYTDLHLPPSPNHDGLFAKTIDMTAVFDRLLRLLGIAN